MQVYFNNEAETSDQEVSITMSKAEWAAWNATMQANNAVPLILTGSDVACLRRLVPRTEQGLAARMEALENLVRYSSQIYASGPLTSWLQKAITETYGNDKGCITNPLTEAQAEAKMDRVVNMLANPELFEQGAIELAVIAANVGWARTVGATYHVPTLVGGKVKTAETTAVLKAVPVSAGGAIGTLASVDLYTPDDGPDPAATTTEAVEVNNDQAE